MVVAYAEIKRLGVVLREGSERARKRGNGAALKRSVFEIGNTDPLARDVPCGGAAVHGT